MVNHLFRICQVLFIALGLFSFSESAYGQTSAFTNPSKLPDNPGRANAKSADAGALFGAVTENRVRFSAFGEFIQLRLEVINSAGDLVFDSNFKAGNALDWLATDNQRQALVDGLYLCLVTVKDATGRLSKYRALMNVDNQVVSLRQLEQGLLAPAQAEAAGGSAADEAAGVTLIEAKEASATAVLAHDGQAAQLVSASGGLTISSGNFFSNKVMEQVRLTAEGNLGLGVSQPQVRLDVNGMIRVSEGLVFPDGSVQFSASRKTFGSASLGPGQFQQKFAAGQDHLAPDIGGTGTTGRLAKWQDGPNGILNDSNITEASGAIGINGTPSTSFRLDVNGSTRIRGSNPGFNLEGLRAAGNLWVFQTVDDDGRFRLFGQDNVNPGVERLTIKLSNGNVGIGATAPNFKLEVIDTSNTGLRVQTNAMGGTVASFGGVGAFNIDANGVVGGRLAILENGRAGIGINSPTFRLDVFDQTNSGLRVRTNISGGTVASFGGTGAFNIDASGTTGGRFTVLENGNVGIGANNPAQKLTVSGTGIIRALVNSDSNAGLGLGLSNQAKWSVATVSGGNFQIFNDAIGSNAVWIDTANNNVGIGTTTTSGKLTVDGGNGRGLAVSTNNFGDFVAQFGAIGAFAIDSLTNGAGRLLIDNNNVVWINTPPAGVPSTNTSDTLIVNGAIRVNFPTGPSTNALCKSLAPGTSTIVLCSSSIRYKTNVNNFTPGLNLISRLRPVSFNWKQGGMLDLGLIAEEVAEVEPLLATYDEKGTIQGVKYERLGVVLINAVKEQQQQITNQQAQIVEQQRTIELQRRQAHQQAEQLHTQQQQFNRQQQELEALKKLVCASHRNARVCK